MKLKEPLSKRVQFSSAGASASPRLTREEILFSVIFIAAVVLVISLLVLAGPLGDLLPRGHFHFLPSVMPLIYHKSAQQMRYLLAAAFVLGLGLVCACAPVPRWLGSTQVRRTAVRVMGLCGLAALVGVAVWSWKAQFHDFDGEGPTTHFGNGDLVVAFLVAGALVFLVRLRPHWLDPRPFLARRPLSWAWFAIAALVTVCWLLPSVFREQNLATADLYVTFHLQYTFDDFVAVVNGRTPLVNYAEQYSSLLPFVVWPILRLGGPQVGIFTFTMCGLTFVSLLSVERALALITRNEILALVLYVPVLATSLFYIIHGSEPFNWASYYAVFPMRYLGPFVLFWVCMRHLRGLRPRSSLSIFILASFVVLNNVEFGLPALLGAFVAVLVGERLSPDSLLRTVRNLVVGFLLALAAVSVLTLLVAGQLPRLSQLTLYSRFFSEGGFGLLPTPLGGLYMIVDMTFGAAVVVGALRYRDRSPDVAYTAALVFIGIFGLGASNYYMGRTHPAGLVVLFAIWAISVALLALLVLRALAARRLGERLPVLVLAGAALVSLGLLTTSIAQIQPPWTELRRITTSAPPPPPYDISTSVAYVRRTSHPGESVLLLAPLGHQIAYDAGVSNISPVSNPANLLTYEQLSEALKMLREAGGHRVYTAQDFPEVTATLTADHFKSRVDPVSGLTEWRG